MPTEIDIVNAAVLGAIQGLTEFLPVSSSGHISIGALLFSIDDAPLTLSIVLHLGTLLATLVLFAGDTRDLIGATLRGMRSPATLRSTEEGRTVVAILIASVPTAVIGLLLKDRVELWSHVPWIVGVCLFFSAVMVFSTRRTGKRGGGPELTWRLALLVGIAQGVAVLPGISRSGTTIAVAMMLGMSGAAAFRFSFLLSLPAVAGAVVLSLSEDGAFASIPMSVWLGGAIAFFVGIASLRLLRGVVDQGRFWAFALYLIPVGACLIVYDLFFSGAAQ